MSAITKKIPGAGKKWYRSLARHDIPSDSLNIIEFNFWRIIERYGFISYENPEE